MRSAVANVGVALLGLGPWGRNLAAATSQVPGLALRSVFDPRYADSDASEFRVVHARSQHELLSNPEVQAVLIATPPETHAELALCSLDAGRWTFVEKPLATSERDALRLVAASQGRLMVGHLLAYHPTLEAISKLLEDGVFGRGRSLVSYRQSLLRPNAPCAWWNLGVHDLYLAFRWFGWPERLRVLPGEPLQAELRWSNGDQATFFLSAHAKRKRRDMQLSGSGGSVQFDDTTESQLVNCRGAVAVALGKANIRSEPALVSELRHFLEGIRKARGFRTDALEGLSVVRLLQLGQRSMDVGGTWVSTAEVRAPASFGL